MPEPGGDQHQSAFAVRKVADHASTTADLTHDPLKRIVRPDANPVLPRKRHVRKRFLNPLTDDLSRFLQLHGFQLLKRKRAVGHRLRQRMIFHHRDERARKAAHGTGCKGASLLDGIV